ncbi:MAG: diguanylate cyclase [Oscillatoriales cyanobacterium]|nr:MAG: diguanylate cyclase [Oscillatoriales cyanobacterium]
MELEAAIQQTFATGLVSASVAAAARQWMALPDPASHTTCLLVLEGESLVGIVLPRDLLRALATQPAQALGQIARPVVPLTSADLTQAIATEAGLKTLVDRFSQQQLEWLPLVDDRHRPVGLLPLSSLCQESIRRLQQQSTHRALAEQQMITAYQELRSMLDALPDMVFEIAIDQLQVKVLPTQLAQSLGRGGDLINQMVEILTHPDRSGPWLAAAREAVVKQTMISLEYSLYLNQQDIWFAASIVPISDRSAMWVARDISDRKQAERALAEANVQLKTWIEALERRNHDLKLLGDLSSLLQTCLSIEEAGDALPKLLAPLFPQCSGGLYLYDDLQGLFSIIGQWGSHLASNPSFTFRQCWALRRGRPHWIDAGAQNLRCQHVHDDFSGESLCVPIAGKGAPLGMLHLCAQPRQRLAPEHRPMAVTVAEHLALALADMQLRQHYQQREIHDEDSQLFNRRYLEQRLDRDLALAARNKTSLSVIAIALDGLELAERLSGRDCLRNLLQQVTERLRPRVHEGETLGCYGKHDLLLLLPGTDIEEACYRAEQLRQLLSSLELSLLEFTPKGIGAAMGIACFPNHGCTAAELIHRADLALYRARSGKGNWIVPYSLPSGDRA